jgi:23S rRNA (pseudouridine1915-N3)-methyltransferase
MKITIISVGKQHDSTISEAIATYETRLKKHCNLAWELIPPSDKGQESRRILDRLRGYVILLDETGVMLSTPDVSARIERLQNDSVKELIIVIGGAYGVTDELKQRADLVWSLSPLVFPHQLVRLILVEQLYRAYDLLSGGKYHHS